MSDVSPKAPSGPVPSHTTAMEVLDVHLCEPPEADKKASMPRLLSVANQTARDELGTAALTASSRSHCHPDKLLADVPDLEWLTDLQGLVQIAGPHSENPACAPPQHCVSDSSCLAPYPKPSQHAAQ